MNTTYQVITPTGRSQDFAARDRAWDWAHTLWRRGYEAMVIVIVDGAVQQTFATRTRRRK